ncbi:MAG: NUDIX domain-containing protein [Chloroflexota bacterium]
MSDELLDIVNNEDIVIGQEMRSKVHQLGLQHRGVHVFLFTQDGQLLIQKRSKDRAQYPSAWDCSVSEHVKAGESYLEAAIRGAREEMGVTQIELQPLVTFRMNYGPNDNEISTLYRGIVDPQNVAFDPVEIDEIAYLNKEQLLEKIDAGKEVFCRWFVQMVRWAEDQESDLQVLKLYANDLWK